mmetsp:Transcript_8610/g.23621  ORF Transcript_8610/g.23621 Transcript_8610/m.23621 type:complete len:271 (+) Transcript_8610:218-1030(+)
MRLCPRVWRGRSRRLGPRGSVARTAVHRCGARQGGMKTGDCHRHKCWRHSTLGRRSRLGTATGRSRSRVGRRGTRSALAGARVACAGSCHLLRGAHDSPRASQVARAHKSCARNRWSWTARRGRASRGPRGARAHREGEEEVALEGFRLLHHRDSMIKHRRRNQGDGARSTFFMSLRALKGGCETAREARLCLRRAPSWPCCPSSAPQQARHHRVWRGSPRPHPPAQRPCASRWRPGPRSCPRSGLWPFPRPSSCPWLRPEAPRRGLRPW